MGRYDGKSVIITGGVSGIGLATARLLVAGGARVMLTGQTEATLEVARNEFGSNAIVVQSDAASLGDIDALAARLKSEFGTLDALLVCAGRTRYVPFEAVTEAVYDELLAVNAKGPYFTVQKLAPLMIEGSGVVSRHLGFELYGTPLDQRVRSEQGGSPVDGAFARPGSAAARNTGQRAKSGTDRFRYLGKIDVARSRRSDAATVDGEQSDEAFRSTE